MGRPFLFGKGSPNSSKIALILLFWPAEALTGSIQTKTRPNCLEPAMFSRTSIPLRAHKHGFVFLTSLCILLVCVLLAMAAAQSGSTSLELYARAMKQPRLSGQIAGLEQFVARAGNDFLKQDALEVLIWDYTRMGNQGRAQQHAGELQKIDPGNPVAISALPVESQRVSNLTSANRDGGDRIAAAQTALTALEKLRNPEGMLPGDFAALRRHVESSLNGILGLAYVERRLYQQALTPLQQAVAVDPQNPQYAYALGLALLYSKDANQQNAFVYLARAADLTQGTPAGQQIAEFARKEYHKAGGTDGDWNRYLAAAVVPRREATPTASVASTGQPTTASHPASAPGEASSTSEASNRNVSPKPPKSAKLVPPSLPPSKISAASSNDLHPTVTPRVKAPEIRAPYAPVSLGILIETALLTKHNRPTIIATLRDVIEHLRADDEAAILVFSNQLDFEQDLTANDQLLDQAMDSLKPRRGEALLQGIAFAAGHLKRIGKNPNRVLLVISDGRSRELSRDSLPLSAQLEGVKVYCIGFNANGADQRALLERLASYSGGQAGFADDPEQLRMVAMQMAGFLGVQSR